MLIQLSQKQRKFLEYHKRKDTLFYQKTQHTIESMLVFGEYRLLDKKIIKGNI